MSGNGNGTCMLLVKPDSAEQKEQFKEVCQNQGVTMRRAICVMMDAMIDGRYVFRQTAKKVRR